MTSESTKAAAQKLLPFIQALAEGRAVDVLMDNGDYRRPATAEDIHLNGILAFQPTLVPWTFDNCPVGVLVRDSSVERSVRMLIGKTASIVNITGCQSLTYEQLREFYQHSTDGGKTWLPCGTME
jgi:hypothetical protein